MVAAVLEQAEQDLQDAEKAEAAAEAKRKARGDYVDDADPDADPDGDDDADTKGNAKADADADDADKDGNKRKDNTPRVPSWRLKEESSRADRERDDRLRIQGENDALKKQLEGRAPEKAKDTVDVDALRDQANEAMIEGDTAKANLLRRQADKADREQVKAEAKAEAKAEFRAEEDARDLDRAARVVIKTYPFLDSNNAAEKDTDAIESVLMLRDKYRGQGMSAGDALTAAAERVGKLVLRERAAAAKDDEDDDDNKDDKDKSKRKDPATERSVQAIARGADAARRQPSAPIGGKGNRGGDDKPPDPAKMTDAEFEKLTPAEKSRLRGDVVE